MPVPTLTVCLPNYNHAQYLPQAIGALATQSRPPDELLILDDCSTDNSVEIIEDWAARYPFIRLIRHERNQGAARTLADLLDSATGDFVYGAAADDYVLPGFFEQAVALAERHPEAGILFGQVVISRTGSRHPREPQEELRTVRAWDHEGFFTARQFLEEYLEREPTWHSLTHATIYRREAFYEVGTYRTEIGHLCDTFALRAIALKYGACYAPRPWATWRVTEGSFAASEGHDARRMLPVIENLAALMRSEEFRDRFPEDYVARWQRDLEQMTLEHYIWRLRRRYALSPWGLLRGRLLKRWLRLQVALRYHGDIPAFLRDALAAEGGEAGV